MAKGDYREVQLGVEFALVEPGDLSRGHTVL